MPKNIKKFTIEEYYRDTEFVTNSQLSMYKHCKFLYKEKTEGNLIEIPKDYFDYGHGVDAILSGENIDDKFSVGTKPKENLEELETKIAIVRSDIEAREKEGAKPLKAQTDKIKKLQETINIVTKAEGKKFVTKADMGHIKQSAEELQRQPLYKAFENADTQTIIATEIDGVKVKCMLDKLDLKNKIICDDKTSKSVTTTDFSNYLQQLAWYRKIVREVYGVECHCYLAVVDKNKSKNNPWKRSTMFYAPPEKLDSQEELNEELLKEFIKSREENNYPPCTEEEGPEMREEKCFQCDNYLRCDHAKQKEFIIL